jgi:hypothetical protein
MPVLFLLLRLLLPLLLLSVHTEDLGELIENTARLSGLSGLVSFFGFPIS